MAVEQFVNNAVTTLTADMTTSSTSVAVTSAATFPAGPQFRIQVESELMLVTAVSGSTFTVTRAIEGTTAATHDHTDPDLRVTHVLTAGSLAQHDADMMAQGLASAIPTAGIVGRLYYATDTTTLYRDNGSAWDVLLTNDVMAVTATVTGGQTMPNAVGQPVTLSGVINDTGSPAFWASGTPTRLTAPATGWYILGAFVHWNALSTTPVLHDIRINGSAYLVTQHGVAATGLGTDPYVTLTTVAHLTAGDYFETTIVQFQGSSATVERGTLWMALLR